MRHLDTWRREDSNSSGSARVAWTSQQHPANTRSAWTYCPVRSSAPLQYVTCVVWVSFRASSSFFPARSQPEHFFFLHCLKLPLGTVGHPIGWATVPSTPSKKRGNRLNEKFLRESNTKHRKQQATLPFNLES